MIIQETVQKFFTKYPERNYSKGETIIQAGDKPLVFYIVKGTVSQCQISGSGNRLVVNTYRSGAFLPIASVVNDLPTQFYFDTNEELVVHVAPARDVMKFLESNPDVVLDTLKRMSRGADGLLRRLASSMEGNAEGRIMQELEIMTQRFGDAHGIAVTEVELAAQTGLARETVSRVLKRLRQKGEIIRTRGHIKIPGDFGR